MRGTVFDDLIILIILYRNSIEMFVDNMNLQSMHIQLFNLQITMHGCLEFSLFVSLLLKALNIVSEIIAEKASKLIHKYSHIHTTFGYWVLFFCHKIRK